MRARKVTIAFDGGRRRRRPADELLRVYPALPDVGATPSFERRRSPSVPRVSRRLERPFGRDLRNGIRRKRFTDSEMFCCRPPRPICAPITGSEPAQIAFRIFARSLIHTTSAARADPWRALRVVGLAIGFCVSNSTCREFPPVRRRDCAPQLQVCLGVSV